MTSEGGHTAPEVIGRGRVEALSDGVFAIVVTLLVLEITVPQVAEHETRGSARSSGASSRTRAGARVPGELCDGAMINHPRRRPR